MKISKVEIVPIHPRQGLIGFAAIEIDEELFLSSIGIHCKKYGGGYRLTYPTRGTGPSASTLFHPTAPYLSRAIEQAIFDKAKSIFEN